MAVLMTVNEEIKQKNSSIIKCTKEYDRRSKRNFKRIQGEYRNYERRKINSRKTKKISNLIESL